MKRYPSVAWAVGAMLAGCAGAQIGQAPPIPNDRAAERIAGRAKIAHVVVIVQENRTVDNLFNGFPGADTAHFGYNSHGDRVSLKPESLADPFILRHTHESFSVEYNRGNMNGWNNVQTDCLRDRRCPPADVRAFGYVPHGQVEPYWTMAKEYSLADEMFQTNQGPSFPAHQYLVSGTSSIATGSTFVTDDNPARRGAGGGCDSKPNSRVPVIDELTGRRSASVFPCFNRLSLMDEINQTALTWAYYQEIPGPGLWHGPDAIEDIRKSPQYDTWVKHPSSQVLTDIANGNLANIVWVTPSAQASDHVGVTNGTGPDWVASVVNAIGKSRYWNDTVILVTWDDWGGWYDHVTPAVRNADELGFRVPMIVVSPYTKAAYVSHVPYEFGSILKFVEETFGLKSLGTTDVGANDLSDFFNFNRSPRRFRPIQTKHSGNYFLRLPVDPRNPDDD